MRGGESLRVLGSINRSEPTTSPSDRLQDRAPFGNGNGRCATGAHHGAAAHDVLGGGRVSGDLTVRFSRHGSADSRMAGAAEAGLDVPFVGWTTHTNGWQSRPEWEAGSRTKR
jgi:hypothetical protein